jgi:hypothetical protein
MNTSPFPIWARREAARQIKFDPETTSLEDHQKALAALAEKLVKQGPPADLTTKLG